MRDHSEPPVTDMSMAAWPSITPTRPLSACSRASRTICGRSRARNSRASSTIISGPPTNSAAVNCQPSSTARMMPSSTTRLVEANWNAIALVKSAPLRNTERAIATAAYEQEEEAAPSPQAIVRERGGVVGQQSAHLGLGHHRLDRAGDRKAQDQRPEDLPAHGSGQAERVAERVQHDRERRHQRLASMGSYTPS